LNRYLTNAIRWVMDECVPAAIRDSRPFMFPFYRLAYRGQLGPVMDFKSRAATMTRAEYVAFYRDLDSLSRRRATDLTPACAERLVAAIDPDAASFLDVGCGNGWLATRVAAARPALSVVGCDVRTPPAAARVAFACAEVERLPFRDGAFDVVACSHTLEHVADLGAAWRELRRVARRRLLVVVPRQRYFYYTLDEHLHFFPDASSLARAFGLAGTAHAVASIWGDWLLDVRCGPGAGG